MKTIKFAALFATALVTAGVLVACAVDSGDSPSETNSASSSDETGVTAQAESLFQFDTSAIAAAPATALPTRPLTVGAFALPNVQRALLGVTESFATTNRAGTRTFLESDTWHAELDATGGQILAVSQTPSRGATPQTERMLEVDARQRLANFGIPSDELGAVLQRRSMSLDEQDGTTAAAAEVDGYKSFALRGLNGVRVRGHRAVLTYGADGAFRRALVKWPALAASGHKLRTALSTSEIVTRATRALVADGVTSGPATLRWIYVPTATASGEVTLELQVMAIVPSSVELGDGRVVDVGLAAN